MEAAASQDIRTGRCLKVRILNKIPISISAIDGDAAVIEFATNNMPLVNLRFLISQLDAIRTIVEPTIAHHLIGTHAIVKTCEKCGRWRASML